MIVRPMLRCNVKNFLIVAPTLRGWKTFEQWANSLKGAGIANIYSANARINKAKTEPLIESAHKFMFTETFETIARK